ncbi:hypothetical protein N7495_007289 [Penicillium taxi]|uniref:uncharacterized protein n=1 Tax=Penicillium taxi TaxID=168475 RepID=UPI002545744A|nr:uncharacterized protein N7495_007289 [Penicillium taxi]KAJ5895598.1 hypothetical protein N7495_007289 [Penicillium taxi]
MVSKNTRAPKGFVRSVYDEATNPENSTIVRSILVFGAGVAFLHSSLSEFLLPPFIFTEPQMKIIAGSDKRMYYVHPGVFTSFPKSALYAQINGHWKDTGTGEFDWTDFEEQTVECVLSFLYSRDYQTVHSATSSPQLGPGFENNAALIKKSDPTERLNHTAIEVPVHAKVYSFAHRYVLSELEVFSLKRLEKALTTLQQKKTEFTSYLRDAIHIIYSTTPGFIENPAREMLSRFVSINFAKLDKESMENLMAEGGDFAVDVWRELSTRLQDRIKFADEVEEKLQHAEERIEN